MGRGRGTKAKKDTSKKKKQASAEKASGGNEPSGSGGAKAPKRSDVATLPCDPMKNLRACMICSLIKSESEFENEGCDNCERWLKLGGIRGSLDSYTSKNFEGMIAIIEPHNSWVAKWQRISHFKQGIYAVNVRGEVEKWIKEELQQVGDPGLRYFSRDKTRPSNPSATRKKKAARARTRNDSGGDRSIIVDNDDTESTVESVVVPPPPAANERMKVDRNRATEAIVEEPIDRSEIEIPSMTKSDVSGSRTPCRSGRNFDADSSSSDDDDAKSVSSKSSG